MRMFRWIWAVCLLLAVSSGWGGTLAQFRTAFGDIEVELYDQDKPATVQNFLRYVRNGLYTNEFSHRLIPGFVLQAGGFAVTNRGSIDFFPLSVPTYAPVTNEFKTGKFYSNGFGTIAMAKTSDPNSATSQFFLNLADNSSSLDDTNNSGGFTVFGHVIAGANVLAMFNSFQTWNRMPPPQQTNVVLSGWYQSPFDTLPLLNATVLNSQPNPTDADLVYIDISLVVIQLEIAAKPNGACALGWNSVAGMTNYVEFSRQLPPVWQLLWATNGNGAAMSITDSSTNRPARFYRVRVAD